jgi:hypothetical protein
MPLTINKHTVLKTCADVVAGICALYPWYLITWVSPHSNDSGTPLPLHLKLMIADILPAVIGSCWLLWRNVRMRSQEQSIQNAWRLKILILSSAPLLLDFIATKLWR